MQRQLKKDDAPKDEAAGDPAPTASPRDPIAENLKRIYREVAEEPLPDRFSELLDKLKKGEKRG